MSEGKLNIVHVLPCLALRAGGPAVVVSECAAAMAALGVESRIFTTDLSRPATTKAQTVVRSEDLPAAARALDVSFAPVRWPRRLAYAPTLQPALDQAAISADLVVIHSLFLYPQYAGWKAAERAGTPYVVTVHGALDPYLRRRGRFRKAVTDVVWQRRMLDRAAALQFATDEEAALTSDISPHVRRIVVPLGVDAAAFAHLPPDNDFRRRRLSGHEGPIILALGRLARKKGLDVLVQAFALVADRHPLARLVLAGPDDEGMEKRLRALAADLGVADRVIFPGMLVHEERLGALAAATVWALPSHTENFGIAAMEALAAGVPVVVSPAVNLAPRLRADGAALVAEATPESFGGAIDTLLSDPSKRKELSVAGRAFAHGYDWRRVAAETKHIYEQLLDGSAAAELPPLRQRVGT